MANKKLKLKIIPLGGLEEIGKNITLFEYGENILIVDCGLAFPEDEMFGVDLVIPDFTYLENNKEKIRGIVLTHGHEDHIGALPYFLNTINAPIYGTELTLGLLENKLIERKLISESTLKIVKQGDTIPIGPFRVEFINSTHSIADAVAIAIHTPVGIVLHTGDFKIDFTPIEGNPIDIARLSALGQEGVLLMLADSTNVENHGYNMSEKVVGETFDEVFRKAKKRILVATFSSNIHRIQQIINSAKTYGRKVAVCGRSMINVIGTATRLGYLKIPKGLIQDIDDINKLPDKKVVIITTGTQGEPMSALSRIAVSNHRKVNLKKDDLVVISASPIPGNEKLISKVINKLFKQGADVVYAKLADIHVSGHACKEELKLIHTIVRPQYFIPVHGEYRHLKQHAKLAADLGMPEKNIFIMSNGSILEVGPKKAIIKGKVNSGSILVDGLGVGDVGNKVLQDRKHLSEDGIIMVSIALNKSEMNILDIEVVSRGFVFEKESGDLIDEITQKAVSITENCLMNSKTENNTIKNKIKSELGGFLYQTNRRRPMIMPIILEIN